MSPKTGATLRETATGFEVVRRDPRSRLAGLCVLLAGLGFAAAILGSDPAKPEALAAGLLTGLLATSAGLALACYRSGVSFDAGRLRTWWGFGRPWRSREIGLETVTHIELRKEIRGGRKRPTVDYPVVLVGERETVLLRASEPLAARRQAEVLARRLHKPLHNTISGVPVVRRWDELDLSLRDRLLRKGRPPEFPKAPEHSRIALGVDSDRVTITVPGLANEGARWVPCALAVPIWLGAAAFWLVVTSALGLPFLRVPLLACVTLPFVVFLVALQRRGPRGAVVEFASGTLRVRDGGRSGAVRHEIPTAAIEEITCSEERPSHPLLAALVGSGGVTITTDDCIVTLGRGLDAADRRYLVALLEHLACLDPKASRPGAAGAEPAPQEPVSQP